MSILKRSALVLSSAMVAALLTPVAAAQAVSYPTVTITSPTAGSTQTGIQAVQATGTVDPAGTDQAVSLKLYVNNDLSDGDQTCTVAVGQPCTKTLLYDAGGKTGNQTLRVDFTTKQGHTVSASVVINAYSPPPTVTIVSPTAGFTARVGDQVVVDVTAQPAPSQGGDNSRTTVLLVDGKAVDAKVCAWPPTVAYCPLSFDWDTTGLPAGDHTLQAQNTTFDGIVGLSPVRDVTLTAATPPTVTMTAPAAGSTVTGMVAVQATSTVDPSQGDSADGMILVVDGQEYGNPNYCEVLAAPTCSVNLIWDTTLLPGGTHTVAVELRTELDDVVTPAVTVTTNNPPPSVAITSPTPGATVSGIIAVQASAAIPTPESDLGRDLQLLVDGAPSGAAAVCPLTVATARNCAATLYWDSTGHPGQHTLAVQFDTAYGRTVTSAAVPVVVGVVQPAPLAATVTLLNSATRQRGANYTATGVVLDASTHRPIVGTQVTVTFTPVSGPASSVVATTDANGAFSAADPLALTGNTVVLASLGPALGSASARITVWVMLPMTCALPAKAHHGLRVTMTCDVRGLPNGATVVVHEQGTKGGPHVLGSAKAKSGKVRVTFVIAKGAQRLQLWATTAASASLLASRSLNLKLHVL